VWQVGKRNFGVTGWFIQTGEEHEDLGPYRPSELLQKVRAGEVTPETMLRKGDSAWFVAGEVGGLFEAAMRPTIEYFCPQCETAVPTPPVVCHKCGREIHPAVTKITENSIVDPADQSLPEQAGRSVQQWLRKKKVKRNQQDSP
jgi:hypothetical protein